MNKIVIGGILGTLMVGAPTATYFATKKDAGTTEKPCPSPQADGQQCSPAAA